MGEAALQEVAFSSPNSFLPLEQTFGTPPRVAQSLPASVKQGFMLPAFSLNRNKNMLKDREIQRDSKRFDFKRRALSFQPSQVESYSKAHHWTCQEKTCLPSTGLCTGEALERFLFHIPKHLVAWNKTGQNRKWLLDWGSLRVEYFLFGGN